MRAALPKIDNGGSSESCGEVFRIQSGPLKCNLKKGLYLLRCKIYDDTLYTGKTKTKFRLRFNNYKSKHRSFRKGKKNVPQKSFHSPRLSQRY